MRMPSPQPPKALLEIATPAYVTDMEAIARNLAVASRIRQESGCKILLALKAFSQWKAFAPFIEALDGTTASGLYEAQLGHEEFGKEIHVYAPAYNEVELKELAQLTRHIYFNTPAQIERFAPLLPDNSVIGLRINPEFSQVKNNAIYDPSNPTSRFGTRRQDLTPEVIAKLDALHVHNLCENMAQDSAALIDHLMAQFGDVLAQVRVVNLGGGHYFTHADYEVDTLIAAIQKLRAAYDVEVVLEPGGALAYDAGYLVSTVLDIVPAHTPIAVLDTSATCHMPDVLEVPYTPNVLNASGPHRVMLAGKTCLTGDVIGEYGFAAPLAVGDRVIFTDMAQYSMVKNTNFNGVPLPSIGIIDENGLYTQHTSFDYPEFKARLS